MLWDVRPYDGAGPLRLGMAQSDVERILGAPKVTIPRSTSFSEHRALGLPIIHYENHKVREITLSPDVENVLLFEIDVFRSDYRSVRRELIELDRDTREYLGANISIKFGISWGGFDEPDEDDKTITVFERGLMDDFFSKGSVVSL